MYVVTIILIIYIPYFIGFHPTPSARADEEVAVTRATTCWEMCLIGPYRVDIVAGQSVPALVAVVLDIQATAATPAITFQVLSLAAFLTPSLNIWNVVGMFDIGAHAFAAATALLGLFGF